MVYGREVYYIPRGYDTMRYNRSIPLGEEACEMCASTTVSINKLTLSARLTNKHTNSQS